MVGRVIGKGGETIKALQKQTGATVQIEQTGDPCKVTISGLPPAVDRAAGMVQDIINGGNPLQLGQFGESGRSWCKQVLGNFVGYGSILGSELIACAAHAVDQFDNFICILFVASHAEAGVL